MMECMVQQEVGSWVHYVGCKPHPFGNEWQEEVVGALGKTSVRLMCYECVSPPSLGHQDRNFDNKDVGKNVDMVEAMTEEGPDGKSLLFESFASKKN
eukprot:scaffold43553_cov75-Attheya_sp.AAC.2